MLRAFTANDRKAIKLTAEHYPDSEYYDTAEVLTKLGIGEAFVSSLNEKGIPSPLARTMLRAPMSWMDILIRKEIEEQILNSKIASKYNKVIDRESAYELLNDKIVRLNEREDEIKRIKKTQRKTRSSSARIDPIIKVLTSATFIRGFFGILKKVMK